MSLVQSFTSPQDQQLSETFLRQGYVLRDVDNRAALDALRHEVVKIVCDHLQLPLPEDDGYFLNHVHEHVGVAKVNELRLTVFNRMNAQPWFRPTYYGIAKSTIDTLVGNELAMQSKINFSVQMPNDQTSTLGIHADTWSAETPFQVVCWLPLVDVFETKAMYILPPQYNREVVKNFKQLTAEGGSAQLFDTYRDKFIWVSVPYGKVMVFSPILLHGNIVNVTSETRWSCNVRFTGLFTPYTSDEKRLGTFYLPITTKVVSRVGMNYSEPGGFDE